MARTVADIQAELDLVNISIADTLKTGKSYSRPGFNITRIEMKDLLALRKQLETDIRKMSGVGAGTGLAQVGGGGGISDRDW